MKKNTLLLFTSLILLLCGCSNDTDDKNKSLTQQDKKAEVVKETLEVFKEYEEEIGQIEAYYINENIEQTYGDQDIDLTLNSVEYGKVLINEIYRSTYEDLADEEGKNTYIKVGLEITGEASQFSKHTFYAHHSSIIMDGIPETAADTTFSDNVAITRDMNKPPISGYVYFLIDHDLPISEFQFIAPAPFTNENSISITEDYVFDITLE